MSHLTVGRRGASCLKYQKRVVSSIFSCGPSKVWLDPNRADEISKARTREALRALIDDKAIRYNVNPRKPKPGSLPTEVANRKVRIQKKRNQKLRMKQKSEFHSWRSKQVFPLSDHPSLNREKDTVGEKE